MTGSGPSQLPELAAWAASQLPRLIDEACAATVDRIPFYRDGSVVDGPELRRSVDENLRFLIAAIGRPPAVPPDLAAPSATGRRRAHQGAPLPEVLQCYRLVFTTLWDALLAHTGEHRRPEAAEALLAAAGRIFQLTDQHAIALTEAYRAATAELMRARQARRSALVEALLTGYPGPAGPASPTGGPSPARRPGPEAAVPWEAAEFLGLHRDGVLVVVAAETRGLAEASLPDVEKRLEDQGIVSGWRLTPARQLGVVSFPEDRYDQLLTVLRATARARTGLSPAYASVHDTPRALRLAQAALAGLPSGRAQVREFDPSPLAALMVYESDERRRLTGEVLGAVLGLPVDDRSTLLETLNAYLDNAGSAERAAEVLHCHANTVRYRLRRVQELTGRSLADPHGMAELAAAAFAVRLDGAGG